MRKWINLFEAVNTRVYRVRSAAHLKSLLLLADQLRGMLDDKGFYVWNAFDATHADIARETGMIDAIRLTLTMGEHDATVDFSSASRGSPDDVNTSPVAKRLMPDLKPTGVYSWTLPVDTNMKLEEGFRRGLAPIGEMSAKVFWQPLQSDMKAMLAKSKLGDLRGGLIVTESGETLVAVWPARNLGHWNFFNECFIREGIHPKEHHSFRITRDLETLTEERYWKKNKVYVGDGFYCAFTDGFGPDHPYMKKLLGPLDQNQLTEAPITNHELKGPVDNDGNEEPFDSGIGFGRSDTKLLQSKAGIEKIYRAFAKTPHDFEFFFVNSHAADGDSVQDNNNVDRFAREYKAGVHSDYHEIKGKPGVIRVVLLSNLSPPEGKMPLTGWTVAHKIAHALQDECYNRGWRTPWAENVKRIIQWANDIADEETDEAHIGAAVAFSMHVQLPTLMTMRSAREGKLTNDFEVFAELIAQYLVSGEVKLKVSPALTRDVASLNQEIRSLFDALAGNVLVEI